MPRFGFDPVGKADMTRPVAHRLAAANIVGAYDRVDSKTQAEGRLWYPKVHDATAKGVQGTSLDVRGGAGVVAAVSPNMDWEHGNIDAFKELHGLSGSQWNSIHASHAAGIAAKAAGLPHPGRSSEAQSALRGLSISAAPDGNLIKAHRIMNGEDVDDVLPRRTAPKTNSFAANIADPSRSDHVTVDGRAHDIAINQMRPWRSDRGISSAALPSGKKSRYEHFEDAYKTAGAVAGELPHDMQAITWVGGKKAELTAPTKSGKPRVQGPARLSQPYF